MKKRQKQTGETTYSKEIPGEKLNHNWPAQFDFTDGYIGITQSQPETERILLTPPQFDELVRFVKEQRGEGENV